METPKNNRSFFRIDVMMPCSYRILSYQEASETTLPEHPNATYIEKHFMHDLVTLDQHLHDIIGKIGEKSELVSQAMTLLNNKIDFFIQTLDEKQLAKSIPQRMVNISGGGVAIKVHRVPNKEDKVDLLIKPLVDEDPILIRCNIIKITPDENGHATVALEFHHLGAENRRKLLYFVQSKEIEFALQQKDEERAEKGTPSPY